MNQIELISFVGLSLLTVLLLTFAVRFFSKRRLKKAIGTLGINPDFELENATRVTKVLKVASWILDPCTNCGNTFCRLIKVDDSGIWTTCDRCGQSPDHPLHVDLTSGGKQESFPELFNHHLSFMENIHNSNQPNLERRLAKNFSWREYTHPTNSMVLKVYGNSVAKLLKEKGLI
jgi:hypothetical protein